MDPLFNMVKVGLYPLSEQDFVQILKKQNVYNNLRGAGVGDINIFRTKRGKLHGAGILSTITNLGKMLLPSLKKYLLPAAGRFTSGVIKDISKGKKFKESVTSRGKKNLKRVGSKILSGKGLKKKNVEIRSSIRSVKRKKNIGNKSRLGFGRKKKTGQKGVANKHGFGYLKKKKKKARYVKKRKPAPHTKCLDIFS